MNPTHLAFFLLVGHFALDYPLQGDTTAREKNPGSRSELQKHVPWYYWMVAHALMHAGAVAILTQSAVFTVAEFASHFALDYSKCRNKISIHQDQLGHLLMKLLYVLVFVLTDTVPGQIY